MFAIVHAIDVGNTVAKVAGILAVLAGAATAARAWHSTSSYTYQSLSDSNWFLAGAGSTIACALIGVLAWIFPERVGSMVLTALGIAVVGVLIWLMSNDSRNRW